MVLACGLCSPPRLSLSVPFALPSHPLVETYHMVDTCDPAVASWSEDGETFVVKNTDVFEKQIIPQFFKHSKFSSFVRQLNFYGFRKIKYHDTIRIDPKLEAETANFWRFHHESFRRGRPDLLIEIKRHGGKESSASNGPLVKGNDVSTTAGIEKKENVSGVKSEVTVLKERIAVMSKNIDNLSNLVQNMALGQSGTVTGADRSKRIKVKEEQVNDFVMPPLPLGQPDVVQSTMSYSPMDLFPSAPSSRQQSITSGNLSDDEFLDDLVHVLEDENMDSLAHDSVITGPSSVPSAPIPPPVLSAPIPPPTKESSSSRHHNRPEPELMDELGEALSVLPKDIQEIMIRRLISTISKKDAVKGHVDAASALSKAAVVECDEDKINTPSKPTSVQQVTPSPSNTKQLPDVGLPMAAATLGALLSQYGMANANKANVCIPKSMPAIPVHQKIPVHA